MAVLVPEQDPRFLEGETRPLNLGEGGQQGAMRVPRNWVSMALYLKQKVIAVLVTAPGAMKYMPSPEQQVAALKALIELTPQTIDGLKSTTTWTFATTAVGHAGAMMETPTDGKVERSIPQITWAERWGGAIGKYWLAFGNTLVWHPQLTYPGIVSAEAYLADKSPPMLPDMMSFMTLFIEPDETMTRVTRAWLIANMMPTTSGEITGKREMGGAGEVPQVSVTFTALELQGAAVHQLALNYMKSLKLSDLRPAHLKSYVDAIAPNVVNATKGYAEMITESVIA
jgi:hypothetical protein